ncbi:MAG: hypothetical protein E5Y76_09055 [Mesorhizobium sp.]|nr:MAG: hypothetical protein E5Y76_09055 [Mesorhizobium sp.]
MTPQQRTDKAKQLRQRSLNQPNLSVEDRKELRRAATNLEAANRLEERMKSQPSPNGGRSA